VRDGKYHHEVGEFLAYQNEREFFNTEFSGSGLKWLAPNWVFANAGFGNFHGFEKPFAQPAISFLVEKR